MAHLLPFHNFSKKLEQLKQEHPKARHFVVAYRYLNEYDQVVEYSTDDGEPSGTSGKPSLMVLQGQNLINVAVIVVRYFGGTKLGTGGLVRAYSDAVNLVVGQAELFKYIKEERVKISFEYSDIRKVEYELGQLEISIVEKEFTGSVEYSIEAPKESIEKLLVRTNIKIIPFKR